MKLATPKEHALARGYYRADNPLTPQNESCYHWKHAIACLLHGWAADAYNYQDPAQAFRLSAEDYEAALIAAASYPNTPRHEAAVPNRKPVTQPAPAAPSEESLN